MYPEILETIVDSLVPIAIVVVLPIVIVWFYYRNKQLEATKKEWDCDGYHEKNPEVNVQEFLSKLNPPKKSYKEQLMTKMHYEVLWGTILLYRWYHNHFSYDNSEHLASFYWKIFPYSLYIWHCPIGSGCGLLAAYNSAKKTLNNLKDND